MVYEMYFNEGSNIKKAKRILEELHFQQSYPTPEMIINNQKIYYENPNVPGLKFSLDGRDSRVRVVSDKPFGELRGIQKQVYEKLKLRLGFVFTFTST